MSYIILTALIALFFFLFLPTFGAFMVRRHWRDFRKKIIDASFYPILSYKPAHSPKNTFLGYFRFFGSIQAIQDDNTLWIANKRLSVTIDLDNVTVYQLPAMAYTSEQAKFPDEPIQIMESKHIGALPQGTQVMIFGPLFMDRRLGVFRSDSKSSPSILLYEGAEKTILRRTIWGGRHKNEYWNNFTPGSIIAGIIALLTLGYTLYQNHSLFFPSVFAFAAALLPLAPFLPPGIFLFYLYLLCWRRARYFRGERDLFLLPLRYLERGPDPLNDKRAKLPTGELYCSKEYATLDEALENVPNGFIHHFPLKNKNGKTRYIGFGVTDAACKEKLLEPNDPMVESVIIPGDPVVLSKACVKQAKIRENLSGIAFLLGIIINFFILYLVFYSLLR